MVKWFAGLVLALAFLAVPAHAQVEQPISITVIQHTVILTWTASVTGGVVGYNVYRGSTTGGPYTKINATTVTALTYTDSTVLAGVNYFYVATAIASDGFTESVYSNEYEASIPVP
jgi:fibronectin type 3 domain-containing protein